MLVIKDNEYYKVVEEFSKIINLENQFNYQIKFLDNYFKNFKCFLSRDLEPYSFVFNVYKNDNDSDCFLTGNLIFKCDFDSVNDDYMSVYKGWVIDIVR